MAHKAEKANPSNPTYGLFVFIPDRERPRKIKMDIALWQDESSPAIAEETLRRYQATHPHKRLAAGQYRVEAFVDNGTPYLRCLRVLQLTITDEGELSLALAFHE